MLKYTKTIKKTKPSIFAIVLMLLSSCQIINDFNNTQTTANAGPDQDVSIGTTVTLDARNSNNPENFTFIFNWSIVDAPLGSEAVLSDATSANPNFIADKNGTYTIRLELEFGSNQHLTDEVNVFATTENLKPSAQAGRNQYVRVNTAVTLDGSHSYDANDDLLTFKWLLISAPSNSRAIVNLPETVRPSITTKVEGTYRIQLIVNDGRENSVSDEVNIIASTGNSAPMAILGNDQHVHTNSTVTVDGSQSTDADNDTLTYQWSITSAPELSTAMLNNSELAEPQFTPDIDGTYVVQLVVNDRATDSEPASLIVTAGSGNSAPVAQAGSDQQAITGSTVTLNGLSSSDADSDLLSYTWTVKAVPTNGFAALSDAHVAQPTLHVDLDGAYVLQLVVNDGQIDSMTDTIVITATPNGESGLPDGPSQERQTARKLSQTQANLGFYEYLPPGYGDGKLRPLLVFFHGIGENGNGEDQLTKVTNNGPPKLIKNNNWPSDRPFIVLSPQHPGGGCPSANEIDSFLKFAMDTYAVDLKRIYLTGLSCGAIGVWSYLGEYTDEFVAAAVPIAGNGSGAWNRANCDLGLVDIWAFHGDADPTVNVSGTNIPIDHLQTDCPTPPRHETIKTIYPGVAHNSWTRTYNLSAGHDPYTWLLSKSKP